VKISLKKYINYNRYANNRINSRMKIYTFKKQMKNIRGCYAQISFDVHHVEESKDSLTINYQASAEWEHACKAGVFIFYDYFRRVKGGAIDVKIYDRLVSGGYESLGGYVYVY